MNRKTLEMLEEFEESVNDRENAMEQDEEMRIRMKHESDMFEQAENNY